MYRDHQYAARCRRDRLDARGELVGIAPAVVWVFARRQGRIWAGLSGMIGAGALVGTLAASGTLGLSSVVLWSWPVMAVVYALTRLVAGRWLVWQTHQRYRQSGDSLEDLLRLEARSPQDYAMTLTDRLEGPSLIFPLLAVSLLTPLSIHLLIAVGLMSVTLGGFDGWIALSLVLVGHAHLTLAIFAVLHAKRLQREIDAHLPPQGASRGMVALLWTVGASAVPGMVLVCVPPLLVAATGALFVPWAFHWARKCAVEEREIMVQHGLRGSASSDS